MGELNEYLQPLDAPVTTHEVESGFEFDTNSDRSMVGGFQIRNASITNAKIGTAAIGTANIGTLTFNEISGGTATLGGTANGNGVFSVKNASGTEVVRADNTGLTVTGGSIVINNTSGSASFDGTGVVSASNFSNSAVTQSIGLNQQITGTADTLFTSGSLSIVVTRPTTILFLVDFTTFWATGTGYNMSHDSVVKLKVNGTALETALDQMRFASGVGGGTVTATIAIDHVSHSMHTLRSLTAGTHAFTVTGAIGSLSGGLGTLTIYTYRMTYIKLGT